MGSDAIRKICEYMTTVYPLYNVLRTNRVWVQLDLPDGQGWWSSGRLANQFILEFCAVRQKSFCDINIKNNIQNNYETGSAETESWPFAMVKLS